MSSGKSLSAPDQDDSDQVRYLLRKLERLESDLEIANRKGRTLYNEGFRAGRNDWAELTARWRKAFETLEEAAQGDTERLAKILRSWVGRA